MYMKSILFMNKRIMKKNWNTRELWRGSFFDCNVDEMKLRTEDYVWRENQVALKRIIECK